MKFYIFTILVAFSTRLVAQSDVVPPPELKVTVVSDSLPITDSSLVDTSSQRRHSPSLAAILSTVVPGSGQAYNKKYWKMPVIYSGFIYGFYMNRKLNSLYLKYKRPYSSIRERYYALDKSVPLDTTISIDNVDYTLATVKAERDHYRRLRDITIIGLTLWYVMNIVDASVDAYFFDYDISDNLTLNITPSGYYLDRRNYYASLSLNITFNNTAAKRW